MCMCAFIPSFILLLTPHVLIWYEFMIDHDNKLFGDFTNYQCFQNPRAVNQPSCSVPYGWQSFQNI